jgi:LuxR family maltose regulon positive regulatory protein
MSTPLLLTKLNRPQLRLPKVARPALITQMNAGLRGKLTLVCAPAGYGKTTLVLDWLSQLAGEYVSGWFSLDENDNDPVRFLAYVIAAIQQTYPDFGGSTGTLLRAPQSPSGEVILTTLLNEMAAIPKPFILVLDDYHTVQIPAIHKNLATWLEHQPEALHLVLITREDPLLPIARWRARGQLTEIRQDDLRFTQRECADFLSNVMGISISPEDLSALERRTEGWIAGLQLAALSMQHTDPSSFIKAFNGSSRYVLDYLVDEVFSRQPEDVQNFLTCTSILERLSGPVCDAVTGENNSQERLEALEQANLFLVPLDHSRIWYRYHRLFAELLRHRLRNTNPDSLLDLHERASQWFEKNDFIAEAVQHALAAQDWDRVAQILTQVGTEMLNQGEATTLVRWYVAIPREVLLSNPRLCFDYCWPLLLTGHYEEAAELLTHVEQIAQDIPPFLGEILTAQAYLARAQGNHVLMIERSQRARKLLPKESIASRALVAINLGLAYWHMGNMGATEEVLQEALEASRLTGNYYGAITAIIFQGRVLAVRGQLRKADEFARQAIEQGGQLLINALAYLDMSALHYEWNQLAESDRYLQGAFDLSRRGQNEEFEVGCWMMLSCLRMAQGDLQGAQEAIAGGQEKIDKGTIPLGTASRFELAKLRLALAQGDLRGIQNPENQLDEGLDTHNFNRFTNLSKARVLLMQHQREDASQYLMELAEKAQKNGWGYALIAIRAWQALAARTRQMAGEFLQEAIQLAQPEGLIRTFIEIGVDLIPHLQEAARQGIEPTYVRKILSAFQSDPIPETFARGFAEPLSEREIEVLRLVVAGLSNREIAQNLVVSLGTAKTHIHNIYSKLEVSNRAQAIARARDFELV